MPDYVLLMHDDVASPEDVARWPAYLDRLAEAGVLRGGSSIGDGITLRRAGAPAPLSPGLTGFIRIEVPDMDAARSLLEGNPAFEAGATVEIRELPAD